MRRDGVLAFAMLAVEAAAFARYSRDDGYGYALAAAGAAAVFGGLRYDAVRRWMGAIVFALAAVFTVYGLWGPTQAQLGEALLSYRVTHTGAMFWMAVQCAYLFARWDRIPPLYLLSGLLALTLMGDQRVVERDAWPYQGAVALMLALAVLMASRPAARAGRRASGAAMRAGLAALGAAAGVAGGTAVYAYQHQFERMLSDLAPEVARQATGFSDQSQLNSVQRMRRLGDEDVMLRVRGAEDVSYFAGRAFEYYQAEEWYTNATTSVVDQVSPPVWMDLTETFASQAVYRLSGDDSEPLAKNVVTPDWSLEDTFFRPIGAAYVRTMGWAAEVDAHDSGNFVRSYPGEPYLLYTGGSPPAPSDREQLLAVPGELDPRVRELAATIIEGADSEEERFERVAAHMRESYRYANWGNVPREEEPISFFLLGNGAGSCEYFASGTTILLRLAGIPCRYVTGFLVAERQEYGDYRLARSRDAHAWVEAYVGGTWRVVDTTPEEGRPSYRESSYATFVMDAFRQMRREVGALFSAQGAQDVWVWMQTNGARVIGLFLSLWPLWLAIGAAAGLTALAGRLLRRRWVRRRPRGAALAHPLTAVVAEGERRSARGGFVRASHETLHGFAERIGAAGAAQGEAWAAWFRAAGDARYAYAAQDGRLADWAAELRRTLPARPPRKAGTAE